MVLKNLEECMDCILKMPEVELDGEAYKGKYELGNWKSIENWMNANLKGRAYANISTGENISISAKGVDKIVHHANDEAYQKNVIYIPQIIEGMEFLASESNEHVKKGYYRYDYFITPVKMDGKEYTILSIVGITGKNSYYYDQVVMEGNIKYLIGKFIETIEKEREGLNSRGQLVTSGLTSSNLPKGKYSRLYKILEAIPISKYNKFFEESQEKKTKNLLFSLFCVLLFSCAATVKQESATYRFSGKNEWKSMASDFRYPTELEERIGEFLGVPYLLGGDSKEGMDCSAFVRQVYAIYGLELPRTSILQSKLGIEIPRRALLPGDLVFFGEPERDSVTHVGIYMGDNKFANATVSQGVKYSDLDEAYFAARFLFGRRIGF
jgi:hypothetical protein